MKPQIGSFCHDSLGLLVFDGHHKFSGLFANLFEGRIGALRK
jgi:hypothetical protein